MRLLLKSRNTAFRSGDAQAYSTSRANLKRGIKKAKHCYKLKIEGHFSNSDPRRMWQGIQAISDYKPTHSTSAATDVNFLNELNYFYARFERDNRETATKLKPSADHPPIRLSSADFCLFADNTTVIGLISNNDETAYREEIQHLATWCTENNLLLNTTKTKELIVDFRKKSGGTHDTIHINEP